MFVTTGENLQNNADFLPTVSPLRERPCAMAGYKIPSQHSQPLYLLRSERGRIGMPKPWYRDIIGSTAIIWKLSHRPSGNAQECAGVGKNLCCQSDFQISFGETEQIGSGRITHNKYSEYGAQLSAGARTVMRCLREFVIGSTTISDRSVCQGPAKRAGRMPPLQYGSNCIFRTTVLNSQRLCQQSYGLGAVIPTRYVQFQSTLWNVDQEVNAANGKEGVQHGETRVFGRV